MNTLLVTAFCPGNPGKWNYRITEVESDSLVYESPVYEGGTNNIAEYVGLVHAYFIAKGRQVHSNSNTALAWFNRGESNSAFSHPMLDRADAAMRKTPKLQVSGVSRFAHAATTPDEPEPFPARRYRPVRLGVRMCAATTFFDTFPAKSDRWPSPHEMLLRIEEKINEPDHHIDETITFEAIGYDGFVGFDFSHLENEIAFFSYFTGS